MKLILPLALFVFFACSPILPIEDPFPEDVPPNASGTSSPPKTLHIEILDIGQGDATLVRGPTGKTLLIDGGREGEGVAVILPRLAALGLKRLTWIVATHYDADHIGGIPEVIQGPDQILGTEDDFIPTEALVDRGDFTDKSTPIYEDYLSLLPSKRLEAVPGMIFDLGGGAEAQVAVVNGLYSNGSAIHLNPNEENEASIGLLIHYGDFQYFTAGDLTGGGSPGGYETKDMETIAGEIIGDIDVLHVGHHGSSSSTNKTFLERIAPEAAVISVGEDNDYGHPTEEVLNRLRSNNVTIYRTDKMGTIEIVSDGMGYDLIPASI